MTGKRIYSLAALNAAAESRRSVICPSQMDLTHRPFPAAFVIQRPGCVILRYLNAGLYIYEKKEG